MCECQWQRIPDIIDLFNLQQLPRNLTLGTVCLQGSTAVWGRRGNARPVVQLNRVCSYHLWERLGLSQRSQMLIPVCPATGVFLSRDMGVSWQTGIWTHSSRRMPKGRLCIPLLMRMLFIQTLIYHNIWQIYSYSLVIKIMSIMPLGGGW